MSKNYAGPSRPKTNYKNIIIGLLALGFLGTWAYLLYTNNKEEKIEITQTETIAKVTDEKVQLQKNFDDALVRLDSLVGEKNRLTTKLTDRNSQVSKLKIQIRHLLKKEKLSEAEKVQAQELIKQLNLNITNLEVENAKLTTENKTLTTDKIQLTADKESLTSELTATVVKKEELEKKVDVASTLNATEIQITPIHAKNNGKEKATTVARRTNKLVISFEVNNRIAQAGITDVYLRVTGPDGIVIASPELGSGILTTREEGEKSFTTKLSIDVAAGQKKLVQFSLKSIADFKKGFYKIEIYHNGFKIGEGTRELKKGGIF